MMTHKSTFRTALCAHSVPIQKGLSIDVSRVFCNASYLAEFICAICEVIRAVLLKIQVFWDVATCRLIESYRRFERS
jgi:hypothetical protein